MMKNMVILGIMGCLSLVNTALAEDNTRKDRDDIRFQCVFKGFQLRKEPIFCEAHGRFDAKVKGNRFTTGDREEHLTVTCGDRLIYDDGIVFGIFRARDREHEPGSDRPVVANENDANRDREGNEDFFDVRMLSVSPFTAAISVENACFNGFDGGNNRANLTVSLFDRIPVSLTGSCRFRRIHNEREHDSNLSSF